jgi:hypothetical protein
MSEDKPLKSAYELAMERLRAEDREAGVEEPKPLTDKQKQEIARLRQEAKAKLAELEILHRDAASAAAEDTEKLQKVEEQHRIDRERIESRLESAVARVRQGKS